VRQVVIAMLAGGHVLLEGLPGLGKTRLANAAAHLSGLPLARVQGTPDLMPSDIVGTEILRQDADGRSYLDFAPGPVFSSFLLLDEVNRAPPRTQSALLEAMQERRVTAGGETRDLPNPFIVMATQNMIEFEGTYPLPEAQLDRFMMKIGVRYPDRQALLGMLDPKTEDLPSPIMSEARVREMQGLVSGVAVADHVARSAVELVLTTHPGTAAPVLVNEHVMHGASPRALKALLRAGCTLALFEGRGHLARTDIEAVALPVLRHRIFLTVGARLDGVEPDTILESALTEWRRVAS
jgi:MoxR-like ATPase